MRQTARSVSGEEMPPVSGEDVPADDDSSNSPAYTPDESQVIGEVRPWTHAGESADATGGREAERDLVNLSHPLAQGLLLEPTAWRLWPAVAVLRWLLEGNTSEERQIFYRAIPSLKFASSEIVEVAFDSRGFDLYLSAPGIASPGSALPTADVERIIADFQRGGGIAAWLDAINDRFMHAVESSVARSNTAFALATSGRFHELGLFGNMAGSTAPLTATATGVVQSNGWMEEPAGAIGLGRLFLGPISASGLAALFEAMTELPTRVEEFTGGEVAVLRRMRIGSPLGGGMLGSSCFLAAAGIRIIIDGRSGSEAREWARNRERRRSLHKLASSYIGSSSPSVEIFLELPPDAISPAALDGSTAIGGLAILGKAGSDVRIPLAA